jgi:hypothetical protein
MIDLVIPQISNTGKTPGADALFSCPGSGEPDSSYV